MFKKLILFLLSCVLSINSSFAETEIIKIGSTLPLSGLYSSMGDNARKGIELALSEVNQEYENFQFQVVFEDVVNVDLAKVASAAQKLINIDKVDILCPLWSEDFEVIYPLARKNNLPVLTIRSGDDTIHGGTPNAFRVSTSDRALFKLAAKYLKKLNYRNVVFIAAQSSYFLSMQSVFKDELEQFDDFFTLRIIEQAYLSTDFRSIITRTKQLNPDAVVILSDYQGKFFEQARQQKLDKPFISFYLLEDPSSNVVAKEILEGIVFPSYKKASKKFHNKFEEQYDSAPLDPAEYSYDAIKILAHVVNKYGKSLDGVRKGMLGLRDYQGASGNISINQYGHRVSKEVELLIMRNGKPQLLDW